MSSRSMGFYIGTMMNPTKVLAWDPCPAALSEILTVAHMEIMVSPVA